MKRSYVLFALLAGAVLGRLPLPVTQAEDPPPGEVHTCPFCTQEVEIPDTPAGAFMKVKIGVATENLDLLRENLLGFDGTAARDAGAAYRTLTAQLVKVDVSGDAAILVLAMGGGMVDLPAVRDGGKWKIDIRSYRNQQMAASGRTVLADLHARVRRFVESSGHVPRSGEALWSDLKSAGLLELRLLNTPRDAERVSQAEFDASDWSHAAFRITADPLSRDLPPGKPVAWEKSAHDGKRLVLYASGVVVELDQAAFDAAIEKYEGK
ncbi:MAG: hypothetical protein IT452_14165 [Planctomycetia bacterium]|nr:hypothetical protein [Planctomycetia bacterium]